MESESQERTGETKIKLKALECIEWECYNKPKSEDAKQPQCPPDKEAAIVEALKFYGLIAP